MIILDKSLTYMKDIYSVLYDTSGGFYVLISLLLRSLYDWERTTIGQKIRQFIIGLFLAILVNKTYIDVFGTDIEMMKYVGAVTFACAFLGEIGLDIILKRIIEKLSEKNNAN